ncbi:50S ribosomal protein L14e [miscellaneous Crenarchaeota group-15 archaeon DG-45]|uniref:50S ribosomal protein L14e n=1 Tax=miscellaneous Crenarchaeota group-15 archaeon DG-45 TaxID=1685127 RepID=A0A0M0BR18_9ARCH|nr:MAG: 50S ribosomal protein L14e [miscellaneous Crenarchaeota group-15 archaeon DG-45]
MSAMEVGRVCLKTRGREAGGRCVIVDIIDRNYVLVTGLQGEVRRRRVNMSHLQPLDEKVAIEKDASDEEVAAELQKLNQ